MRKLARLFGLSLALSISISAVACGGETKPGGSDTTTTQMGTQTEGTVTTNGETSTDPDGKFTDQLVTYSFLRPENALQPYNEDSVTVQEIERRTGIAIDVMIVPAGDWGTKMNALMATQNMPDFFRMWTDLKEVVNSGNLLALDEYITDDTPLIKELYETVENLDKSTVNGQIYALPTIRLDDNLEVGATPNIRVDLVKELGFDIPTNWDELYVILAAFKENYPDSIPWGTRGEGNLLRSYTSAVTSMGAHYGLYQDNEGSWKLGHIEESYKDYLTFMNQLYSEGILDNEYIITSADDWKSGLASGKYLFYYDNPTFINSFNNTLQQSDPDAKIESIPFLQDKHGQISTYGYGKHTFNEYGFSADIDNPELAMKLFNWLYDEEGALLMNFGVEGEDYELIDGEPMFKPELIEDYRAKSSDPYYAAASDRGFGLLFFTPAWYSQSQNQFMTSEPNDVTAETIYNVYKDNDQLQYVELAPIQAPYTDEEAEEIQKINQNINDFAASEINKFVTGERSLDTFDDYVAEMLAKGAEDLMKIANEAEARYLASKN